MRWAVLLLGAAFNLLGPSHACRPDGTLRLSHPPECCPDVPGTWLPPSGGSHAVYLGGNAYTRF